MAREIQSLNNTKLQIPQQIKQLISKKAEEIILEAEINVKYH